MWLFALRNRKNAGRSTQQHDGGNIDRPGPNLYEHLAGVNDLLLAQATFAAAVKRWPGAKITLRNGARIIDKTWPAAD